MEQTKAGSAAPVKLLIRAMAIVGVLILLSDGFFEFAALKSGHQAQELLENGLPSAERLTRVQAALARLDTALDRATIELAERRPPDLNKLSSIRGEIDFAIDAYGQLPRYPDEVANLELIRQAARHLDEVLQPLAAVLARGDRDAANRLDDSDWRHASDLLDGRVRDTLLFNVEQSNRRAQVIRQLSSSFTWGSIALVLVLFGLGTTATVIAARSVNRQLRHDEARAAELEMFAGRVAHDLLSPLSAVQLSLQLLAKEKNPRVATMSERGLASVRRVSSLVEGLFDFAASGGQADQTARTRVRGAVAAVVEELTEQAQRANIELRCGPVPDCVLACRSAVFTIVLTNLIRNSIKYMGEQTQRQIDVFAEEEHGQLRFEVVDSGPGLAPGLENVVFEPYMRGRSDQHGMGLGLATVKRLVEAHGGQVGLRSVRGGGATFWFTLPVAPEVTAPAHDGPRDEAHPGDDLDSGAPLTH